MTIAQTIVFENGTTEAMSQHACDAAAGARELSARVGAGDEAAFRELYDDYAPRIRRFVLALSRGNETHADEITQQTFLTAARKLRAVESEAHLWNWLARVARQHLGKAWRRQNREGEIQPLGDEAEIADEPATERKLETALEIAMRSLVPDEQNLIRLFYDQRLSQQEMAARLDTTPKAIANRLDRIREKLRKKITEGLRDEKF